MPRKPNVILGITYGHGDSSAAIIVDGCLLAAVEEERFTRVKHYALFPSQSIAYCLKHAQLSASDVQAIAIPRKPMNGFWKRVGLGLAHPGLAKAKADSRKLGTPPPSLPEELKKLGLQRAKIYNIEHHYSHMMSSRFLTEAENVALLSFDGLGDFVSAAIGRTTLEGIEIVDRVYFPHSVGYFYTAMTQYLGFPHFGDEFKVMGLSSYGQPRYLREMHELIREDAKFGFSLNLEAFPILKQASGFYIDKKAQPHVEVNFNNNFLRQMLGVTARKQIEPVTRIHWDLAKSVQERFEEIANHLLGQLHDRVGGDTLALSGGCAHNSVWVGKIPQKTHYKNIVVAPASSDAGLAVGAAATIARVPIVAQGQHWGLMGPAIEEYTEETTDGIGFEFQSERFQNEDKLVDWMVEMLCREHIIGLAQGRLEFGPRALGSRSIIADPRGVTMKDRLNSRVKHREAFRPFAASVLYDHQDEWFEKAFFCPSMEAVFEVRENMRKRIPAVTHVDNTCRIQSITKETQGFYYKLIEAFRKKTGVPMILNTSFNDSEPIVCTPQDAVRCFGGTDMDHLVIGLRAYSRIRQPVALAG